MAEIVFYIIVAAWLIATVVLGINLSIWYYRYKKYPEYFSMLENLSLLLTDANDWMNKRVLILSRQIHELGAQFMVDSVDEKLHTSEEIERLSEQYITCKNIFDKKKAKAEEASKKLDDYAKENNLKWHKPIM